MGSKGLPKMSLVAQYDDLCRYTAVLTSGPELEFKTFVEGQLNCLHKRKGTEFEVRKLNENVFSLESENKRLETKIKHLKDLLNDALSVRRKVESEKNSLARQIAIIKDVLLADGVMDNQTKEKLVFLSSTCKPDINSPPRLQTIEESAGSLFSPSDIDQTDDDLENTRRSSNRRRRRSQEKRSSSETRASLKKKKLDEAEQFSNKINEIGNVPLITVGHRSNSEPTSSSPEIPTVFHNSNFALSKHGTNDVQKLNARSLSVSSTPTSQYFTGKRINRNHAFVSKSGMNRVKCYPCGHNIGCLKQFLKCQNCRIICHPECKEKCPMPCFPFVSTPTKGSSGTIADFTSSTSPMIPPLIVHCVNEIESRGLKEVGLYRIPGSEREVRALKEKFLSGRIFPCLNDIDIHAICGTIKEFLRSLKEPLITQSAWKAFVDAADLKGEALSLNALYDIVIDLPQPNRDTLSFLLLHLQKVAESPDCKMSIENLAKVFGPTIIGYSVLNPADILLETTQQYQVMLRLLSISSDSWQNVLSVELNAFLGVLRKTPENLPAPKETRLGPIYTPIHKTRNVTLGRNQLTPRNSKYSKPGKMHFSSPLLK